MSGKGFSSTTYDDQDRLTAWNRADSALNLGWTLSKVGDWDRQSRMDLFTTNGTGQSRTHGPAHEITAIAGTSLTHDSRGNLTQDKEGIQYTWDKDNMLASVTVPMGSSIGTIGRHTYAYDALGRRASKTVSSTTTVFACRDQQLAETTKAS